MVNLGDEGIQENRSVTLRVIFGQFTFMKWHQFPGPPCARFMPLRTNLRHDDGQVLCKWVSTCFENVRRDTVWSRCFAILQTMKLHLDLVQCGYNVDVKICRRNAKMSWDGAKKFAFVHDIARFNLSKLTQPKSLLGRKCCDCFALLSQKWQRSGASRLGFFPTEPGEQSVDHSGIVQVSSIRKLLH